MAAKIGYVLQTSDDNERWITLWSFGIKIHEEEMQDLMHDYVEQVKHQYPESMFRVQEVECFVKTK